MTMNIGIIHSFIKEGLKSVKLSMMCFYTCYTREKTGESLHKLGTNSPIIFVTTSTTILIRNGQLFISKCEVY